MSLQDFKRLVRQQFFMLLIDEPAAIAALPALLPDDPAARATAFETLRSVVAAVGDVPDAVAERLQAMERVFIGPEDPAEDGKVRRLRAPRRSGAA
jgi:hypothetical protein